MKLDLTYDPNPHGFVREVGSVQVDVEKLVTEVCNSSVEQKKLALAVFKRREHIDQFPALAAVVRQIAREHCLTQNQVLRWIKEAL